MEWFFHLGTIVFATAIVNNVLLVKFLGLCPFMGVSNNFTSSIGMAYATTFVLTLSSALSYLLESYFLAPLGIGYFRTVVFILVIACIVSLTEISIRRFSPVLHRALGIFLPLITTNCAVLGVALLNVQLQQSFVDSVVYGFASGVGFSLVLLVFASLREKLSIAPIPLFFKGTPVFLLTAAFLSMAIMGFGGVL